MSAEWFRSELVRHFGPNGSQTCFARFMVLSGDTRTYETILRSINNTATGRNRVSGEMRVILALMRHNDKTVAGWIHKAMMC